MKSTLRYPGKTKTSITITCLFVAVLGVIPVSAAGNNKAAAPETPLTDAGQKLETQYAGQLKALRTEIEAALPKVSEGKIASLRNAGDALKTAEEQAKAAGEAAGKSAQAKGDMGIWKKYSLPDATKKIAEAQEQLKTATTDDARAAAQKTLAAQEKRLASLNANIKEAEQEIAKSEGVQGKDAQEKLTQAKLAAEAALAQAQTNELTAAKAVLADMDPLLVHDKMDAKLIKAALLASAAPHGLAEFAAVLHDKATGSSMALKSFSGGMQLNCDGGFKTQYAFEAPQAGKDVLTARVATLQEGQKFRFAANAATTPVDLAVPYTIGLWQQTQPLEVTLAKGPNVLNFESQEGSHGVAIKEFTLTPVK